MKQKTKLIIEQCDEWQRSMLDDFYIARFKTNIKSMKLYQTAWADAESTAEMRTILGADAIDDFKRELLLLRDELNGMEIK